MCTKKKKETGHTKKVADITFGGVKREPPLSFGRAIVPGDKVKGGDEGFLPGEGKERGKKVSSDRGRRPLAPRGRRVLSPSKRGAPLRRPRGCSQSGKVSPRPPTPPPNKKKFSEKPQQSLWHSRGNKGRKFWSDLQKLKEGYVRGGVAHRDSYGLRKKRILFRKTR